MDQCLEADSFAVDFSILTNAQKLFWKPGGFETRKKITQMNKGLTFFNPATTLESP